ncbi:hypothetical protein M0805_003832 [Coniferiporia weirii]|nr:hypothetical protein M0805_003832 [Coniferiporia weirii]
MRSISAFKQSGSCVSLLKSRSPMDAGITNREVLPRHPELESGFFHHHAGHVIKELLIVPRRNLESAPCGDVKRNHLRRSPSPTARALSTHFRLSFPGWHCFRGVRLHLILLQGYTNWFDKCSLWGAGSVQLYFYHDNYSKSDKLWLQLYLYVMYVLDTVHQINMWVSLYKYFVKDFANPTLINQIGRPITDSVILSAIVCALAQLLYLMRIWHLSKKNYILTGILGIFILTQFVVTVIYFAQIYNLTENTKLMDRAEIITVRVLNASITATDVCIATAMAFLLHSQRSGIKQTDTLINRLIMYSIATGLVTGAVGVVALISAFALPKTFIYLFFDLLLPKLYINSILALLNFRQKLRDTLASSDRGFSLNRMNTSAPSGRSSNTQVAAPRHNVTVVDIRVDTDQETHNDFNEHKDPWQKTRSELDDASSYGP